MDLKQKAKRCWGFLYTSDIHKLTVYIVILSFAGIILSTVLFLLTNIIESKSFVRTNLSILTERFIEKTDVFMVYRNLGLEPPSELVQQTSLYFSDLLKAGGVDIQTAKSLDEYLFQLKSYFHPAIDESNKSSEELRVWLEKSVLVSNFLFCRTYAFDIVSNEIVCYFNFTLVNKPYFSVMCV